MLYINIDKIFYIILVKYILLSIIIHKSIIVAIICYTVLYNYIMFFFSFKIIKKNFTGKYCVNIKTVLKKCMIFSIFVFYNTILLYFFILFNSHNIYTTPYTVYSFHILSHSFSHSVINYDKVVVITVTVTSSLTIRRIQTPNFLSSSCI